MHSVELLQSLLKKSCPFVHQKRLRCLLDVVTGLIDGGQLWISALGRQLKNDTTAKHNIKKVDSLVGNKKLHDERLEYYRLMSQVFIAGKMQPIVIVDWSPVNGSCEHNILRASITGLGRTLTLYEEIHELKYYANNMVHENFLCSLKSILPEGCRPIVVTDAGFRNPWYKLIKELGWDYVGRLRHNTQVKLNNNDWVSITNLHARAKVEPAFLGEAFVAKANPLQMNLYTVLGKQKGRLKKTLNGKKCCSSNSKKYAKGAKEPWMIVTSLPHRSKNIKKLIQIYKTRMQIEQSFRDLKDKRHGFRLPESKSKSILRLENLLLIALLATLAIWLAGQVAIKHKWHHQMQANTIRHKLVLSIAFIGLQILRDIERHVINQNDFDDALEDIKKYVIHWEIL